MSLLAVTKAIDTDQQSFRKKFVILQGSGKEMKCDQAWQWYETHKEKFRHPVFVPLLFVSTQRNSLDVACSLRSVDVVK